MLDQKYAVLKAINFLVHILSSETALLCNFVQVLESESETFLNSYILWKHFMILTTRRRGRMASHAILVFQWDNFGLFLIIFGFFQTTFSD